MDAPAAVGLRLSPDTPHVNSDSAVFRVTDHPGLTVAAARRITWMIGQHDSPRAGVTRGPLRHAIMRELGEDRLTRALNLARRVAKHARRAGILT